MSTPRLMILISFIVTIGSDQSRLGKTENTIMSSFPPPGSPVDDRNTDNDNDNVMHFTRSSFKIGTSMCYFLNEYEVKTAHDCEPFVDLQEHSIQYPGL
ncbi:hypothetical protein K449DRAFT_169809 [Hypoxylon sp. EC38]|nr:hypothetical protein K449DRAFT_169809 [Hypoxylon sp. EC38]